MGSMEPSSVVVWEAVVASLRLADRPWSIMCSYLMFKVTDVPLRGPLIDQKVWQTPVGRERMACDGHGIPVNVYY